MIIALQVQWIYELYAINYACAGWCFIRYEKHSSVESAIISDCKGQIKMALVFQEKIIICYMLVDAT